MILKKLCYLITRSPKSLFLSRSQYSTLALTSLLTLGSSLYGASTKTVGNIGSNYATLKAAFDAINAGTLTGDIVLQVKNSTTETATATLYQSGYGSSNYNSVKIYPINTGKTISGAIDGGPVIDLNNADNVTIDGRLDQTGTTADLTITNTSTSSTAGTSTIRFMNDATNNTVQYSTIKGAETNTSSGILFFSTTTGSTGNDNNTIAYNNITGYTDAYRPVNAVYSLGTSAKENNNNSINYNAIYNVLNRAIASNGISLSSFSTEWTISNNHIYETSTFIPTASVAYNAISVNNSTGTGFIISGNKIGGSSTNCVGTWTTNSGYSNIFYGISLNVGSVIASSIQNNTIKNFSWTNTGNPNWAGIYIAAGTVNVGTSTGNTIGASTGTGSIYISNSASSGSVYGISASSNTTIDCQNNTIGSITATNTSAANATNLWGINTSGSGTFTINNNFIGSAVTANSIQSNSPSNITNQQFVVGINSSSTGISVVNGNTVANLKNAATGSAGAIMGIFCGASTSSTSNNNSIHDLTISNSNTLGGSSAAVQGLCLFGVATRTANGNTIYNLSNTYSSFSGYIHGIFINGSTTAANTFSGNLIYNITVPSTAPAMISGIRIGTGGSTFMNNIVTLNSNSPATLYGIYENSNSYSNFYHNTIYINGSTPAGTLSFALVSYSTNKVRNIINNIFYNARSSSASTNVNYAAYYSNTTNLTQSYNCYYANGTGGALSNNNTYHGNNENVIANPNFTLAGGTNASDYIPTFTGLAGTTGTGISTDYAGTTRTTQTMGAYDIPGTHPIFTISNESNPALGVHNNLKNAFDKINDGTYTGDVTIKMDNNSGLGTTAALYQSGYNGVSNYQSVHIYPTRSGISIFGDFALPLIDLNGADNVSVDGRVNATGSNTDLTIVNNSTLSGTTSTLRFINDATNNNVQYCTLKGSNTSAGIINFSTATSTGNDYNTINNNNITCANEANRPTNAIMSLGSISYENDHITISNNNIYNFLHRSSQSNGVNLSSNTTACTISGNSFYETTSLVPAAAVGQRIIYINNTSGVNFTVNNNYIGGQASLCGGGAWTKTNANDNNFYAIDLNVGTSTASNVQGNIIKNINYSNSGTSKWYGIAVEAGQVNVGTSSGNIIGANTGTSSITFTGTGATELYGIQLAGTGVVNCQNNLIGAITTNNSSASNCTNFYGINKGSVAGTTTISNNLIGSTTTSNSIQTNSASTTDAQTLVGIRSSGTGAITISSNIISNASNASNNSTTSVNGYTSGIFITDGSSNTITNNRISYLSSNNLNNGNSYNCSLTGIICNDETSRTVSGNEVSYLSNTNSSFAGTLTGIYFKPTTSTSIISANFIHDLSVHASSNLATINGLTEGVSANTAIGTVNNNIVSLGANTQTTLQGFRDNGGYVNCYYNTFYISGSLSNGASNPSYALCSNNTNNRSYKNNLFINVRSTASGTNIHYAANISSAVGLTQSFNNFFASGQGGILSNSSYWSGTGNINTNPDFVNAGGALATHYYPRASLLTATPITGLTSDFGGIASRSATTPVMGAWEIQNIGLSGFSVLPYNTDIHSGYTGSTVTITGNFLGNVSMVKVGGADGTTVSSPVITANSITFTAPEGVNGTIYLTDGIHSVTSSDLYSDNGYITASDGDWDTAASWLSHSIPGNTASATIAHQITVTPTAKTIGNLTVNSGAQLTLNNTLNVNGTLANSGTLTIGTNGVLGGSLTTIRNTNAGTIQVQNTEHTALAADKTWTDEVIYNGSHKQTLTRGTFENLTIANSDGTALNGTDSITVNGTLTINSGYLEVGTARKVDANTITNNVGVNGIFVKSAPGAPNGTLIFHNATPVAGTVEYYTKAYYDATGPVGSKYKWQFFGSPVSHITANPTCAGSYVRSLQESTNTWISLKNDSVLKPMRGYEVTQTAAKTISFSGNINNQNISTTLAHTNTGTHLLSNPYTCAVDIKNLNFGDGLESTVYMFNTGSAADMAHNADAEGTDNPGQYIAIPKNLAGMSGLPSKIPSMQGFIINTIENPAASSTVFGITYAVTQSRNTEPQRTKQLIDNSSFTQITIQGAHSKDQMWMVDNSNCTPSFDNGWDGHKIFGSSTMPQIYALEGNENLQVDATNDYNNTSIGFIPGVDTEYTMLIAHKDLHLKYPKLYLQDLVTGEYTDISEDNSSYSFNTTSTDPTVRFRIVRSTNLATSTSDIIATSLNVQSQQKDIILTNNLDSSYSFTLYSNLGGKVIQQSVATGTSRIQTSLASGVYFYSITRAGEVIKSDKLLIE